MTCQDTPEYRKHYKWGWNYSQRESATLDYVDSKYNVHLHPENKPAWNAALDGYLDYAASREKWHIPNCKDHDCQSKDPEHVNSPEHCGQG
jgi:hypothetical protein